jgi:phage terminase large subunit-like protein
VGGLAARRPSPARDTVLHSLLASELLTRRDSPDVFCAAGSREQARIVFNFGRSFVETGPLLDVVKVGRNELIYPDGSGSMRVVSADGSLQFGHSVSCAIVDEAHVFATQKHQDLWEAFETALHKRLDSFLLAITTAASVTRPSSPVRPSSCRPAGSRSPRSTSARLRCARRGRSSTRL